MNEFGCAVSVDLITARKIGSAVSDFVPSANEIVNVASVFGIAVRKIMSAEEIFTFAEEIFTIAEGP